MGLYYYASLFYIQCHGYFSIFIIYSTISAFRPCILHYILKLFTYKLKFTNIIITFARTLKESLSLQREKQTNLTNNLSL